MFQYRKSLKMCSLNILLSANKSSKKLTVIGNYGQALFQSKKSKKLFSCLTIVSPSSLLQNYRYVSTHSEGHTCALASICRRSANQIVRARALRRFLFKTTTIITGVRAPARYRGIIKSGAQVPYSKKSAPSIKGNQ